MSESQKIKHTSHKQEVLEKYGDSETFWYEDDIPSEINGWIYIGSLPLADNHTFLDDLDDTDVAVSVSEIANAGYKVRIVDMSNKSDIKELGEWHGGYTTKQGYDGLTGKKEIEVLRDVPNYEKKKYFWTAVNEAIDWMKEKSPKGIVEEITGGE